MMRTDFGQVSEIINKRNAYFGSLLEGWNFICYKYEIIRFNKGGLVIVRKSPIFVIEFFSEN